MRNIKLTIEYDGTHFEGWQIQTRNNRTVQGEIRKALKKIFKEEFTFIGAGRTDSGVHAVGQVANFKTNSKMPIEEIQRALNGNLPFDISILKVEEVSLNFHSQFDAQGKIYRYTILNRKAPSAVERNFCLHYPYKLNLSLMKKEAKALIGKKDFRSFTAKNAPAEEFKTKNTIRTLKRISIKKEGNFIFVDIEADGFLYKMVRNIVGTLLEIASSQLPPQSIKKILKKKDRSYAGTTAKAKGLCLLEVKYSAHHRP